MWAQEWLLGREVRRGEEEKERISTKGWRRWRNVEKLEWLRP